MGLEDQSLRQLFHGLVSDCYVSRLGMRDAEISTYIADLLTEFCRAENVYRIRDRRGHPVVEVDAMLAAADPVFGAAASFDEERELRKHIGDSMLFFTGMYPDSMHLWRSRKGDGFLEMVRAGKESYYIVSQFDLFEYAREAPFFARLATSFEDCMYGLSLVREKLDRLGVASSPAIPSEIGSGGSERLM